MKPPKNPPKINKFHLVDHLTHKCGLSQSSAIRAVDGMIGKIASTISAGGIVYLKGIGTINVVDVPAHEKIDPDGLQITHIPARRMARLFICHALKVQLNPKLYGDSYGSGSYCSDDESERKEEDHGAMD